DTSFHEWATIALQQIFKRFPFDILHYQEIPLILRKEMRKSRQTGMMKSREHLRLNAKILDSEFLLRWWYHGEAHLFNGTQSVLAFHVLCLINCPHTTFTDNTQNYVALME